MFLCPTAAQKIYNRIVYDMCVCMFIILKQNHSGEILWALTNESNFFFKSFTNFTNVEVRKICIHNNDARNVETIRGCIFSFGTSIVLIFLLLTVQN